MSGEERAVQFRLEAEKKLKGGLFGFLNSTRFEEAADLYTKSGNQFKLAKKWDEAASAFCKAAEIHLTKAGNRHEAAGCLVNASNCYRKTSVPDSIRTLQQAIELYTEDGRFSIAAKHQKDVAEMYEKEMDMENAINAYQTAADFFSSEASTSAANGCLLKVATFSAELERYAVAVEILEKIAESCIDNKLLKWSVKDYYLKAGICLLCMGVCCFHFQNSLFRVIIVTDFVLKYNKGCCGNQKVS
ncbi:NAPA [Balamuthia mandrillaris]